MKVLVTGAAGFIGMHTALRLIERGEEVFGIDNINDYYDISLKEARLRVLLKNSNFCFRNIDISDRAAMTTLFQEENFTKVVHLAAQAGVRYSIENPAAYVDSNLVGFVNILEGCRHAAVEHLVYASSSSVYGGNTKMPFSEHDGVNHPISLYAATKKANELMAHTYSHLYKLPTTGLRFFTVYGPWGRPDMAPFIFANSILKGEPIKVFNAGNMKRDFTYIDDIVDGVLKALDKNATPETLFNPLRADPSISNAPYRIFNVGNESPIELMRFIEVMECKVGKMANKVYLPMQPGDVPATYADGALLRNWIGPSVATSLTDGVEKFVNWYRSYYNL